MKLRIATWNMGYWQHVGQTTVAWEYLDQVIAPDIALVQEAIPPSERKNIIWRKIGGRRNWGSGICSYRTTLREFEIETSYNGSVIAADIMLDNSTLTVISLYGLIDKYGYAITSLHRIFSDLTPLLVGKLGKRSLVIGGDFNASLQCDEHWGGKSHNIFFQRLEDFGLVNCLTKFYSGHVQTLRHSRSTVPWQNDYIFATKDIAKKLVSCEVIDDKAMWNFSDHNPVVATFDL